MNPPATSAVQIDGESMETQSRRGKWVEEVENLTSAFAKSFHCEE